MNESKKTTKTPVYDPYVNHNNVVITLQPDGNYKGLMYKNGKVNEVRAGDPHTVLELLLTHA